ncbi:hypothetical protein BS78_09G122600 [Paspalum vaginatum]|nr:hypothetical protein BS78_09G122600 [Paspalum vaginatum]
MAAPAIIPGYREHSSRILAIRDAMQHCVAELSAGNVVAANTALLFMSCLASPSGDPMQRVAFAFAEALGHRALGLQPGLSWALQLQVSRLPFREYTHKAQQWLNVLSPLLRITTTAADHVIVAAMEAEKNVHVVDLGGASPKQWLILLRLFAARPGGAPSLRLTVVSEHQDYLSSTGGLLTQEAVRLHVPFVFNPVQSHIDRFSAPDVKALGVEDGQALVITCTLQLHRLIADMTTVEVPVPPPAASDHQQGNTAAAARKRKKPEQPTAPSSQITKADALLRVLRDLSPKLVVLTEQEADHNGVLLWNRICNALDYYAALFNDLEAGGAPRESGDRAAVERLLLREEIMDIVARDGPLRRERHEKVARWALRMRAAGFEASKMSFDAFAETVKLAQEMSGNGIQRHYRVMKHDGNFIVYSGLTPMFSVSAWQPARRTQDRR